MTGKIRIIAAIIAFMFGFESAHAAGIEGTWMGVGPTGGGKYVNTMRFFANGIMQYQLAVTAPSVPGGSSITSCQGRFQFNGRELQLQASSCQTCGSGCVVTPANMWPNYGGPVNFANQNVFSWGDTTYRRQ